MAAVARPESTARSSPPLPVATSVAVALGVVMVVLKDVVLLHLH